MIFISSQSQTPSGYIRGFEFVPLSHPPEATHLRRSNDCIQPRTPRYTETGLAVHQKGWSNALISPELSEKHRWKHQIKRVRSAMAIVWFRLPPLISFHKLIFIFSIPPHGSGAFPGASVVSSFLSSSLRPLFVRLVNARSWFYFPFAGPPAIPMVGAPGNTPEPANNNEFR